MSFGELLLVALIGLIVIGPNRLPETIRTVGLWVGRLKRAFGRIRGEMEREFGMDEVRRQLHNEDVMRSLNQKLDPRMTGAGSAQSHETPTDPSPETTSAEDQNEPTSKPAQTG
ncbi:MAG: Sec-independent protein translocase protein TatB [bacterium]